MIKSQTTRVYDREFRFFSYPQTHMRISQLLAKLPRGKVLDMPAGAGALSYRLYKEGFDVTACDMATNHFQIPEVPIVAGNLDERLPFDDGHFDYVCCIEGPEHTQSPLNTFRQFARVLKPGGRIILSMPNYSNIERRIRALLYGSSEHHFTQRRLADHLRQAEWARYMIHISPLAFAELKFFLECAGFDIHTLARERLKVKQLCWYPLVAAIQLLSLAKGRRGRELYFTDQANSNAVLLGGNTLIVMAVKERAPSL
ncbi:MAG: class I SAM-dependent methyltransferase [Phycisphaeraceae bacterium]